MITPASQTVVDETFHQKDVKVGVGGGGSSHLYPASWTQIKTKTQMRIDQTFATSTLASGTVQKVAQFRVQSLFEPTHSRQTG